MGTYWWARDNDDEWLRIDLGSTQTIDEVVVKWHERYYAEDYRVRVSDDGRDWSTVRSYDNVSGGTIASTFSARSVRYVLIDCERAERYDGFAIYEAEVYAGESSTSTDSSWDSDSSWRR